MDLWGWIYGVHIVCICNIVTYSGQPYSVAHKIHHHRGEENSVQPHYTCHALVICPPPSPMLEVFQMNTVFNATETLYPTTWTFDVEYRGLIFSVHLRYFLVWKWALGGGGGGCTIYHNQFVCGDNIQEKLVWMQILYQLEVWKWNVKTKKLVHVAGFSSCQPICRPCASGAQPSLLFSPHWRWSAYVPVSYIQTPCTTSEKTKTSLPVIRLVCSKNLCTSNE